MWIIIFENIRDIHKTVVLELRVAHTDLGRIIGKQGRIANAIRAILKGASGKGGKKIVLNIVD
jgi:predicted RNA-binding protein YlqC (UPF0109 family)